MLGNQYSVSIPRCLGTKYNEIQGTVCRGALSEEVGPEDFWNINLNQKDWFYPKVFCALDLDLSGEPRVAHLGLSLEVSGPQGPAVHLGANAAFISDFAWDSAAFPKTILPCFGSSSIIEREVRLESSCAFSPFESDCWDSSSSSLEAMSALCLFFSIPGIQVFLATSCAMLCTVLLWEHGSLDF